jgi:hypothetical protein
MAGRSNNKELWIALITAFAAIVVALIQFLPWDSKNNQSEPKFIEPTKRLELAGVVVEEGSNESIGQAKISVVGMNEEYQTQDNGNFQIEFKDSKLRYVRLRVSKPKYKVYDKTFDLPSENIVIKLTAE